MTSPYPFRLAILRNLTSLFQTITIANGYKSDVGSNVFRGRNNFGDDTPVPLISILDTPTPADVLPAQSNNPAVVSSDYQLLVQGFVNDDPINPTDPAHILMADVRLCLGREIQKNGGRTKNLLGMGKFIDKIVIGQGTVRPPETGVSNKAFFWQIVTVSFSERTDDPYGWDSWQ